MSDTPQTPTPLTDSQPIMAGNKFAGVPIEFARDLERRLAATEFREQMVRSSESNAHEVIAFERAAREKAQAGLRRIASMTDAPAIDAEGQIQFGLHCGVEDRCLTDRYEAADYGYAQGVERALEWAKNEADAVLAASCSTCGARLELSPGWVPTPNDPDNAGLAPMAEPYCPKCDAAKVTP